MSRTLALLGGAGFVGTNLALAAAELGHRVLIYDVADRFGNLRRSGLPGKNISFCEVDLTQPGFDLPDDVDVAIHLAALPHVEFSLHRPAMAVANNVLSVLNILEAARHHKIPLLFTSSIEVYGGSNGEVFDEASPLCPLSPYAASKIAGEQIISSYASAFGVTATIVRLTNLYGPWQVPDRLVPRIITRLLAGLTCEVESERLRNFVHVSDAVGAILSIIDKNIWGELFNIGTGLGCSTRIVAESLAEACARPDALRVVADRKFDGRGHSLVSSGARLMEASGWTPQTDLAAGLAQTVEWYRANREWWEQFAAFFEADRNAPRFIVDFGTWDREADGH